MKTYRLKTYLIIVLKLFFAVNLVAQTPNTNISSGIFFDGEPNIAVNPTNPQHIVVSWMGLILTNGQLKIAIKSRATFNGGSSWSTAYTHPHYGTGYGSADPTMAFDKNGKVYLAYIDYKQNPDSGGIYITRSTDGGLNWDVASKAFDMYDVPLKRPIDRPWLVCDRSNTTSAGTLYITTKPAPWIAPPNRSYYKVSIDGGYTWSNIKPIDDTGYLIGNSIAQPLAAPAVTADGLFCAAYPSYVTSQNVLPALYLAKSSNQGTTLSYTTMWTGLNAVSDTNFKKGYCLLTDPGNANNMTLIIPLVTNSDLDVMTMTSLDGGNNWNALVRVNDDALNNGKAQDMVWGSYNEAGNLIVTWRDRRDASGTDFWNNGYEFYYALSSDNGQTFSANQKLSTQFIAFDSIIAESGNDFMGCAYLGDTLYAVWGDTRNNRMNIYFTKTQLSTNTGLEIALLNNTEQSIKLYPQPTSGTVQIIVSDFENQKQVSVFNVNGMLILQMHINYKEEMLDLTDIPAGTYFIKAGDAIEKLVKQ